MRILYYILTLSFAVFAAIQLNDPDPLLWAVLYAYCSVTCFLTARDEYPRLLGVFAFTSYTLFFLSIMPETFVSWVESEEAREAVGILICVVAQGLTLFLRPQKKRRWERRRNLY